MSKRSAGAWLVELEPLATYVLYESASIEKSFVPAKAEVPICSTPPEEEVCKRALPLPAGGAPGPLTSEPDADDESWTNDQPCIVPVATLMGSAITPSD